MPQPRQSGSWPTLGEYRQKTTVQFATPTYDAMGGRGEPTWTDLGTWYVKFGDLPIVPNDTEAVSLYTCEGTYRSDVWDKFHTGTGIRIVTTSPVRTLKVFLLENPQFMNRTLVAHCASAVNTQ